MHIRGGFDQHTIWSIPSIFFFNDRSLDENELIRQVLQVILSYEFIGVQIYVLVSDAGGGSTKMFKLLQGHNAIRGPCSSAECLSFKNPYDYKKNIYIWMCGTRGFKAMCNNVYRSQLTKSNHLWHTAYSLVGRK